MSFNLRFASTAEPHIWTERRPAMRTLLHRERPHVIGTQEGLYHQVRDIAADLGTDYAWIGTGRGGGSRDEFKSVFYDTRRLDPLEYDHFWLSDTPDVMGSNTWGGACIRMVTWIRFRDLQHGGREFYALITHLDNKSRYARTRAASLIADRIAGLDRSLPLVLTGDFNVAAHKGPVYDTLLGAGLVDTWDTAAERTAPYGPSTATSRSGRTATASTGSSPPGCGGALGVGQHLRTGGAVPQRPPSGAGVADLG